MPDSRWLSAKDPNSYANIEDVTTTSLDLDLAIDFKRHILKGSVTLSLEKKNPNATKLVCWKKCPRGILISTTERNKHSH